METDADVVVDYNLNLVKKVFDYQNQIITLHEVKNNSKILKKIGKGNFFIVNESNNTYINGVYKTLNYKRIKRYFNNVELLGMSVFCQDNNTLYYIVRDHTCYNKDGILCIAENNKKNSHKDKMEDSKVTGIRKILKISSHQKENLKIAQNEIASLQQQIGFNEDSLRRLNATMDEMENKLNSLNKEHFDLQQKYELINEEKENLIKRVEIYKEIIERYESEITSAYDKIISDKVFLGFKINSFRLDEELGKVCVLDDNSDDLWKRNDSVFNIPHDSEYTIDINGKDSSNFIICLTSSGNNTRSNKSFKGSLTKGSSFYVEYVGSMKLPNDNFIEISYQI